MKPFLNFYVNEMKSNIWLILAFVVVIVIILAIIELEINKSHSRLSFALLKDYDVIMPDISGCYDPIYIYNAKRMKRREIKLMPMYSPNDYEKKKIETHVASRITNELRKWWRIIKGIPSSNMPINMIYSAIGKSGNFISSMDPLYYNPYSNFRILTSKRDNVEAFVSGGKIHIIR